MGKVNLRSRDLNRFRKTYPGVRWPARDVYTTEEPFQLESATVSFGGSSTITYEFENTYDTVPNVVVSPLNESMNVFITSITRTSVVIGSSAPTVESVSIVVVNT